MQDDIELLFTAIRKTAEAEKADILAQAEQEIARINERAEAQMERLSAEAFAQLEEQLCTESERILGGAELEMRDRLVRENNEALDRIFSLASKEIAALDYSKTGKEILKRLIQQALNRTDSEDVRLRISKTDLSLWESLKEGFPASIQVELCDGPKGTVVVETSDGSQSIDNSIDTRLEMAREVMKREVGELLFAAGKSG